MSERKPVEAVSAASQANAPRVAERVVAEARTREAREEREPDPPPAPVEPSPAFRPYRVQLDPETSRLFTEVVDQRTGQVITRIPAGYKATTDEDGDGPGGRTPAREVKL